VPTHVALLRGIDNLGSKRVTMAELREAVTSSGHTDVMTYIQSGNVLFTPRLADSGTEGAPDTAVLATELERVIAAGTGVQARAVVLSREELIRRADLGPGGRHGAELGDGQQAGRAARTVTRPAVSFSR
jgi:uncharacterized protein (DUF1697 family)